MSTWRRLRMGLTTVLGLGRQGFFIPYRHADAMPRAGFRARFPAIEARFRAAAPSFLTWLDAIDALAADLSAIGEAAAPAPRWGQMWFPRLDAAMAYTLLRKVRPRRVVEVGSGHSTRFLARAVADGGFKCQITCIDPAPRASIAGLAVERIDQTLSAPGLEAFANLQAGDVVFIDSSHILMPGSDVDLLLNQVLPSLAKGVLVHVHDIFLPDDYPAAWAWRGYNEQQGVAALLAGGGFRPIFSSRYVITRMAPRFAASAAAKLPFVPGSFEASLWLLKEV